MASYSVITVTTGEAGSGKSYARCARFVVDRFLRDHDGPHISNFPLGLVPDDHSFPPEYEGETFAGRMAATAAKLHGLDEGELRARIQTIPAEELAAWEAGTSGPWEYFEGMDLQDAHIAIDEIHNYCDAKADAKLRKRWKQWLGEIRHQGATVEFLSQALQKVPIEIRQEAGLQIAVKNTESERDPVFRIRLGDWYELRAGFVTGRYSSNVLEEERRAAVGQFTAKDKTDSRLFPLDPWYFRFYDSFSKPQKGGNKGRAQRKQFEKRGKLGLLGWFLAQNAGRLVPRVALGLALAWVFFGQFFGLGGGPMLVQAGMARIQGYTGTYSDGGASPVEIEPSRPTPAEIEGAEKIVDSVLEDQADHASPSPAEVIEAVATMRAKVAELEEQVAELEAENQVLRVAIDHTAELVALTRDSITFRNGFSFRVGETIDYGPFEGQSLDEVIWSQRAARLSGGALLRLSRTGGDGAAQRLLDAAAERQSGRPGVR